MKKNTFRRIVAMLLVVVMSCSSVVTALAESQPAGYDLGTTATGTADQDVSSVPDGAGDESLADSTALPDAADTSTVTDDSAADAANNSDAAENPAPAEEPAEMPDSQPADSADSVDPAETPDAEPSEDAENTQPDEETPGEEEPVEDVPPFVPLEISETAGSFDAAIDDEAELFVKLNRDDVNVHYQWQKHSLERPTEDEPEADSEETNPYEYDSEGAFVNSGGYFWPFVDVTEAEWLVEHPDDTWSWKWLWDEAVELAGGDASRVHIPMGAKSLADVTIDGMEIVSEEMGSDETADTATNTASNWADIEGETGASYLHIANEDDNNTVYRCVVTIDDEAYFAAAAADAKAKAAATDDTLADEPASEETEEAEEGNAPSDEPASEDAADEDDTEQGMVVMGDVVIYDGIVIAATLTSSDMSVTVPEEVETAEAFHSVARALRAAPRSNRAPNVTFDGDYLVGLDKTMEYITKDTYDLYGCSNAGNAYWTKLAGGTRPDGSTYASMTVLDHKMPILSAWYGKTVYVRYVGDTGTGTAIQIPAYTGVNYQTGEKTMYKRAVSLLDVRVPETGQDFYREYTVFTEDPYTGLLNGEAGEKGCAIFLRTAPLDESAGTASWFNLDPDRYLKDAEGNYCVDSVAIGVCVSSPEPDLSGKAAWALKDYIAEGYGFMTGHDMMYTYLGVSGTNANYVPDRNSTTTPYYHPYSGQNGHFNMNWLMGTNKAFTEASPYEAASMVLCLGGDEQHKHMVGTGDDDRPDTRVKVTKVVNGDPLLDVNSRVPTNYPYSRGVAGKEFTLGCEVSIHASHTNNQIAFGNIWFDYVKNYIAEFGEVGEIIEETVDGLKGTNNFYLTTNGNFAMNQVGHLSYGRITQDEMRIFANAVMYISQRQQCQVCQSKQGGNDVVHFVHRIYSAEQLQNLNNPDLWFTYPSRNCYMLSADITLPEDWEPIRNFDGHFHADGHTVTLNSKGTPLFANDSGTMDQHASGTTTGWNIGTDSTKGLDKVVNANKDRTTGIARVSGYLASLFSTGMNVDWSDCKVVVHGTDGKDYTCYTNMDGKYVISNVPCTGIMKANVYDRNGRDITEYGPIRVNVPESFWNTDETTPLYLLGFTAIPVVDQTVYEGQTAYFVEGGVYYNRKAENIAWQYRTSAGANWQPISTSGLDYTINEPEFHDFGDDSYTTTSLTIRTCRERWTGYQFRAVFVSSDGRTADTYSVRTAGKTGTLTVLARPMYVSDPQPKTIWLDGTASFTASCDAYVGANDGRLRVQWQMRKDAMDDWHNVDGFLGDAIINKGITTYSVVNTTSDGTIDPEICPYKTTSTLTINCAGTELSGYEFRAHFEYNVPETGDLRQKNTSDNAAELTVKPPAMDVAWVEDQAERVGVSFDNPVLCELGSYTTGNNAVVYEGDVTYYPGKDETGAGTPNTEVIWRYHTADSMMPVTWNAQNAAALASRLGVPAPTISFENSAPVQQPDGSYKIHAKMTMTNLSWKFYSDDCMMWFSVGAVNRYKTIPYQGMSCESMYMPLVIDFKVDIKWNNAREQGRNIFHQPDGVKHSAGNTACWNLWKFPDMTVDSAAGVKTLLLYFDTDVENGYDRRDRFALNGVPDGMRIAISNPHYLMLVGNGDSAVNDKELQQFLRQNLSVYVYDTGENRVQPKLRAYINANENLGGNATMPGVNVNFYAEGNGVIAEGQTSSYVNVAVGGTVVVPQVACDYGWELVGWRDKRGNFSSMRPGQSITVYEGMSYTAEFRVTGDNNDNGLPDDCEAELTLKVANGHLVSGATSVTEKTLIVPVYDENGKFSPNGTAIVAANLSAGDLVPDAGYVVGEWVGSGNIKKIDANLITVGAGKSTATNTCTKMIYVSWLDLNGNVKHQEYVNMEEAAGLSKPILSANGHWADPVTEPGTSNIVIQWVQDKVEVTWKDADGKTLKTETVEEGSDYSAKYPDDQTETGYWSDPVREVAADGTRSTLTITWKEGTPPTKMSRQEMNAALNALAESEAESIKAEAGAPESTVVFPETALITLQFVAGNGGHLEGQTIYKGAPGMTWEELGVVIPTPVADEPQENLDGTITEYSFNHASTWLPAEADRVLTGKDGDVIVVRAEFDANTYEKEIVVPYEDAFEDVTQILRTSAVARAPRVANITISWARPFYAEGESNTIYTTASASFMQWQVSDDNGATWHDCIGETGQMLIIGRIWGNMAGWRYRLKYGDNASDVRYTNTVEVSFYFEVEIPAVTAYGAFDTKYVSSTPQINVADYVPANATLTKIVATYNAKDINSPVAMAGHEGDVFYGIATNVDEAPPYQQFAKGAEYTMPYWFFAKDRGGLVEKHFGTQETVVQTMTQENYNVAGVKQIWAFFGNGASGISYSGSVQMKLVISGTSPSSGGGVPIRRNDHEAWDLTDVFHDKLGTPAIQVTISAYDKVYDGTETVATVSLSDQNGILSQSELNQIAARGTIRYSSGATTSGTAKSGSGCVDVRTYTATFEPAAQDAAKLYNTPEAINNRSTTFRITQRPINLYSYNNDREYNGNDRVRVSNIQMEAFSSANQSGIVPADQGRVILNTNTFVGSFNEVWHQTNGQQIQILREAGTDLHFEGAKAANYRIGREDYTGAITPRPLYLHSTYHDTTSYSYSYNGIEGTRHEKNIVRYNADKTVAPNNVKEYDNTTAALINNIVMDNVVMGDSIWIDQDEDTHVKGYAGTYADYNAGEKLDANGRVLPDHLNKLTEVSITRTEPISLVNNDHGDYYIASENYSGAIYRALLTVNIAGKRTPYGEEPNFTLKWAKKYTSSDGNGGSDLAIGALRGKDTLTINGSVSKFQISRVIDKNTPAGAYPVTITGINEKNYPVLSNYIVYNEGGSIIVTPRPLTITVAGGYEKYYGDQLPEFGVTITGWANNGDNVANSLVGTLKFETLCKWNSDVRYLSDGTTIVPYTVSAYGLEAKYNENGWQNYEVTYVDGDIKVLPLPIEIRAIEKSKVYGYADPSLDFTMSRARVKESDLQFGLRRVEGEIVGQYDIIFDDSRITDLDRGNYDITFIPAKLTITPRTLIIDAHDYERYYGDENPAFEVRYSGFARGDTKETALENTLKIDCAATRLSPIGSYNIGLSGEQVKENSNGLYNYSIVYMDGSLLVKPRSITIVADDQVKYVGEDDPEFTWHLADDDEVVDPEGAPLHVTLARQPGEEAFGTYPIYSDQKELDDGHDLDCACKIQGENPNYEVRYVPGNLTILDDPGASLVLKVGNASMVYGEEEPVDDYRLIWYMDETGKHDIPEGTDVRDFFDLKLAGNLVLEADGTDPRDVGVYDINGSGLQSGKYDSVVIIPGDLTVTPRPVTLTPHDKVKVYGDPDPELTYSITDDLTGITYEDGNDPAARIKEGDLQGTLSRRPGEDVGKYLIRVGTLGEDPNYTITLERALLEIIPADLIVKVWNHDDPNGIFHRQYGKDNPKFDVKIEGFKFDDDITDLGGEAQYHTDADLTSPMGEYPITVEGFTSDNYEIHYVPGTLEIEPVDVTIIIDSTTKVYGDEDPEFTWHLPEGEYPLDEDTVTGTTERKPGEDVGGYVIDGEFESSDPNVGKIIVIPGILTITPAPLVVKAEDKTKVYGDENPEWTSVAEGLKNGDTLDDIDGEIVYIVKEHDGRTDVSRTTDVGEYPINISEMSTLESPNYVITYENATLTITKRPIDITPGDPDKPARSLRIEKSADKALVKVGETIIYTLTVTNTGSEDLANITVTDHNDGAGSIIGKDGHGYTYLGGDKFAIAYIPVGKTVTISYLYKVVEEDTGKDIANFAVASVPGVPATPGDPDDPDDPGTPEQPPIEEPSNEVIIPVEPDRGLTVIKSADKETAKVGDTINYTLHITNTGNAALKNFTVTDDMDGMGEISSTDTDRYSYNGGGAFTVFSLDAGESVDIHYSYVTQADDAGKILHNVAIVAVPTGPSDPVRGLTIAKAADKTSAKVGDIIHYTLTVTNTGNVELRDVPVVDHNDGAGKITAADGLGYTFDGDKTFVIASLVEGESKTIEYSYTVQAADAGKTITNVAIATLPGDPDDPDDPDKDIPSDIIEIPVDPERDVTIIKKADKESVVVGEKIGYTITVTNKGAEELHGLTVRDGMENAAGEIEAEDGAGYSFKDGVFNIEKLAPGESVDIHYTYTALAEDAGNTLLNVAVVTVPGDPDDPDDPDEEIPSNEVEVPVEEIRDLVIVKRADKTSAKVGETITYTLDVTNTGNVDLSAVAVRDTTDGAGSIDAKSGDGYTYAGDSTFVIDALKVNETVHITYTYTTVRADDGNVVTNVAVATIPGVPAVPGDPDDPNDPGTPEQPPRDIPSNEVKVPVKDPTEEIPSNPVDVPVTPSRNLSITKRSDIAFAKVGDTITYTVDVTNTGNVDLSNVTVKDVMDAAGTMTAQSGEGYVCNPDGTFYIPALAVEQTVSIVYTYVAQEEDAGKTVVNVAIATLPGDPDNPPDPDKEIPSEEVEVPVEPEKKPITIIADPYIKVYGEPDPALTYKISEPLVKPGDVWGNVVRDEGEDVGIYPINRGTIDSDNYEITFIPGTFEIIPAPLVITALDEMRMVGEPNPEFRVTYKGFKFDDGPEDLDGKLDITTPADKQSPVGKYPITPSGLTSPNYDITYVDGVLTVYDTSKLLIEKSADKDSIKVGETVTYTVTLTNAGTRDFSNIRVSDTLKAAGPIDAADGEGYKYLGNGVFEVASLKAGEKFSFTYTYTAVENDLGKILRNIAVAKNPDDPDDPNKDIPSEEVEVKVPDGNRDLTIVKSANVDKAEVGDTVTYTLLVTNVGPMALTDITVKDSNSGAGVTIAQSGEGYTYDSETKEFTIPTLAIGKSVSISYDYIVAEADAGTTIKNVAVAKIPTIPEQPGNPDDPDDPGIPEQPGKEFPSNEVEVPVDDPIRDLSIVKSSNKTSAQVGDTIVYTLAVTNTGNVAIQNVTVTDTDDGWGTITAEDGAGYTVDSVTGVKGHTLKFTIASLAVGATVDIRYEYEVSLYDNGATVKDAAIAKIPTIPAEPGDPDDPDDPGKPEIPGKDVPSNEVEVPVDPIVRDLTIVKSANKTEAEVGETIIYTLTVTNTGNVDLNGVTVKDTNSGVGKMNAASGNGYSYDEKTGEYTIASLEVGKSVEINYSYVVAEADAGTTIENVAVAKIPAIPAVPADPDDPDDPGKPEIPGKDVPSNEVEIPVDEAIRSLDITKSADVEKAKVGDTVTYTITVKNTGNVTMENIAVQDNFSAEGEVKAESGKGYTYDGNMHFTIAKLAPNESVDLVYTYKVVEGDENTTLRNVAVAEIPGKTPDDPPTPVPSEEVDVPVDPLLRDLTIEKAADKETAKFGDTIVYTLTVKNTGEVDLADIKVVDTDDGWGTITAKDGDGYTVDSVTGTKGHELTFTIASLAVGKTVTIRYEYEVSLYDAGKTVKDVAIAKIPTVPAEPGDPDDPDDPGKPEIPGKDVPSNEVEVPVDPIIRDLTIVKSADVYEAKAGDTVNYTLTVTNTGNIDLNDVLVKDENDGKGVTTPIPGAGYEADESGIYVIESLKIGESVEIHYSYVVAEEDVNHIVRNVAVAKIPSIPGTPGNPDDPTDPGKPEIPGKDVPSNEVKIPVETTLRDLSIVKSANVSKAYPGDTITYTIVVKNTGNVVLENIPVQDNFSGKGAVEAKSGNGYTYDGNMRFTIAKLAPTESVTITYTYKVQDGDVNTTLKNVAVASIPGKTPDDPPTPVPSKEVEVPVEPKPVAPPVIVTNNPNPATGNDFMSAQMAVALVMLLFAMAALVVVIVNKRRPRP